MLISATESPWGSDSLTVSPYLGRDSLEPFVEVCEAREAGIFVLVKTSNPGGGLFQDRETDGQTVYQAVAQLLTELNQGRIGPIGLRTGRRGGRGDLPGAVGGAAEGDAHQLDSGSRLRGPRWFGRGRAVGAGRRGARRGGQ